MPTNCTYGVVCVCKEVVEVLNLQQGLWIAQPSSVLLANY